MNWRKVAAEMLVMFLGIALLYFGGVVAGSHSAGPAVTFIMTFAGGAIVGRLGGIAAFERMA